MPWPLLIALFLAFGLDADAGNAAVGRAEIVRGTLWAVGGVGAVGLASYVAGQLVAARVRRRGYATPGLRRAYFLGLRAAEMLTLVLFGATIYQGGWARVVRSGFGLGRVPLIDDVLIILPFLLGQIASWWGFYSADRLVRPVVGSTHSAGLRRTLVLRARQSVGLLLPVMLVFSLGQDIFRLIAPNEAESVWAGPVGMAIMGLVVLLGSPLFVRLAWPTYPLPPGPIRGRLEHLAQRFGFRCTDIRIQETGGTVVNAAVAGTLPWFRYVFLTDALVENLHPNQVAAVFGHEIGHIAHRHLLFFGFFFLGSIAVFSLIDVGVQQCMAVGLPLLSVASGSDLALHIQAGIGLALYGLYFLVVFGYVSRRFERQADVFGCRSVSCDVAGCPPHLDLDADFGAKVGRPKALCPVGIHTFVSALAEVASLNGMAPGMRSWRHGSVAHRIAFLESLEGKPDAERRFQKGTFRLRLGMAAALIGAGVVVVIVAQKLKGLP
jgi:STE24 endopeptidase